jgi:hypothetical protein
LSGTSNKNRKRKCGHTTLTSDRKCEWCAALDKALETSETVILQRYDNLPDYAKRIIDGVI